uniref:Ycf36 n=1 Tax=Gracilaria hainanensis TaxID=2871843 RepID=A0AAU7YRM4_9FLOR
MSISKKKCPVPFDQQPLNEYFALKSSCFFSWSTLPLNKYFIKLFTIFVFIFCISMFLLLYIISKNYSVWQIISLNILATTFIFSLIFARLYLGWSYVVKRLISATIFYEESGWYDGQLWIKSPEVLTKDRLVGLYEVMPFLFRAKYGVIISILLLLLDKIVYSLLLI